MEACLSSRTSVIRFPRPAVSQASGRNDPLKKDLPFVSFHRRELNLILSRYGMKVAAGEWRDYAIDMNKDCAVFSIYRHSSDQPLYRLEKHPKLSAKQGAYLVRNEQGTILKRGHDLEQVLKVFEKKLAVVEG